MTVTRRTGQRKAVLVAAVVGVHDDPHEARRALHQLQDRGFSVLPLGTATLAAVLALHTDGGIPPQPDALERRLLSLLSETDPPPHRQPAFDAVLEAVISPTVPAPSWFSQARRNAEDRQELLDEFGALTSEDIASLVGSRAANRRATAQRWRAQRRIFAVDHHGDLVHPSFQFDHVTGRPRPVVGTVLAALPAALTGWALALWWTTPLDLLDGARPVDVPDTAAEDVARAARAESAEWAQATPA